MTQEQIYKFALETAGKLIEKLETEVSLLRTLNESAERYSMVDDHSVKVNGEFMEVDHVKANADFARSIHNDHSELPREDKEWQEILKPDKVVKEGWLACRRIGDNIYPCNDSIIYKVIPDVDESAHEFVVKITYEE